MESVAVHAGWTAFAHIKSDERCSSDNISAENQICGIIEVKFDFCDWTDGVCRYAEDMFIFVDVSTAHFAHFGVLAFIGAGDCVVCWFEDRQKIVAFVSFCAISDPADCWQFCEWHFRNLRAAIPYHDIPAVSCINFSIATAWADTAHIEAMPVALAHNFIPSWTRSRPVVNFTTLKLRYRHNICDRSLTPIVENDIKILLIPEILHEGIFYNENKHNGEDDFATQNALLFGQVKLFLCIYFWLEMLALAWHILKTILIYLENYYMEK